MECLIFIGLQASGKSTFYQSRFFRTHLRINLDMLRTRHREWAIFHVGLTSQTRMVIDNTNPTRVERARYVLPAKAFDFRVEAYYFRSVFSECMERNNRRDPSQRIPPEGIGGTAKRLELPRRDEGFDAIWYVRQTSDGGFAVEAWHDEV